MKITYFNSASDFRRWLEVNHARVRELWVGFFKKDSGTAGITYAEAVDEALCFGWIDGLKKRVDDLSYTHRFTPRKPKSTWSRINIQHAGRLKSAGRMTTAGLKAFAKRDPKKSAFTRSKTARANWPPGTNGGSRRTGPRGRSFSSNR